MGRTDNGPKRDVTPEKWSNPKKVRGESFDEAQNKPNDPQKRYRPTAFNVTDDYCDDDNDNA